MERQSPKRDLIDIAAADLRTGKMERREFIRLCLWAGVAPAVAGIVVAPGEVEAEANEIVLANFGGDAVKFMGEAWGQPFTKDTGVKVTVDGASPLAGKIKAMVQSGKVTWDVCDADGYLCEQLGKQGLLEETDYSVVDKSMVRPGWAWKNGIANYTYSFVLAYDKTKFPDKAPTYTDFFDTKKYPGKRTMWKYQMGAMEMCLLADGVPADKLYPLDVDRAIKKAKSLGKDVIYWASGADQQQLFMDGEVVMGNIWNTRASVLERDTKGKITWTWDQGLFCPAAFVVPKGNPAGKVVNKFLASILIPERQIKLLATLGNGPSNPKASTMLPPELQRLDPGYEPNFKKQIMRDEKWYEEYSDAATDKWIDGISG
jgi:putative spermidine/putrescine transport system substrate-binding protein